VSFAEHDWAGAVLMREISTVDFTALSVGRRDFGSLVRASTCDINGNPVILDSSGAVNAWAGVFVMVIHVIGLIKLCTNPLARHPCA
jgi:hypothetical protein